MFIHQRMGSSEWITGIGSYYPNRNEIVEFNVYPDAKNGYYLMVAVYDINWNVKWQKRVTLNSY